MSGKSPGGSVERTSPKSGKHRTGPRLALIRTLLHAAATERYWVAERRPSWRCDGRRLAYYRSVAEWAEGESVGLGALLSAHRSLGPLCAAHDHAVAALTTAAGRAHDALVADPHFEETVRSAYAALRGKADGPQPTLVRAIAEHVVNALPPWPAGWGSPATAAPPDRALWCAASARLAAERDRHPREARAIDRALDALESALVELERALRSPA